MAELIVVGSLGLLLLAVLGLAAAVVSFAWWIVLLPLKLLGLLLKGLGFLLALPFLALFGLVGLLVFGFGMVVFLLPILPLALAAWLIWRLLSRPASVSA